MSVLLAVETLLLVLLALLVVGLLRSHAEILRRLDELSGEGPPRVQGSHERAPGPSDHAQIVDIAGETPDGEAVKIAVAPARGRTLLAFLSSGCLSCEDLWSGMRGDVSRLLPFPARLVVAARDEDEESPSALRDLAPDDVPVVMSTEVWDRYHVAGSPYFILFERDGSIAGEGTATSWEQLGSLLRDAVRDAGAVDLRPHERALAGGAQDGESRLARADAELEAAGIGPAHPSLYSAESPPGESDDR